MNESAMNRRSIVTLLTALLMALLSVPLLAANAARAAVNAPTIRAPGSEAVDIDGLATPEQRARYQHLAEELRCLVCQNQTLADSNAGLAVDLRREVETMIVAGHSNDEIKGFLVERYGNFVLYRPPMQGNTWLLWAGPFGLLAAGAFAWWRVQRRTLPAADAQPIANAPDLERARRLLDG